MRLAHSLALAMLAGAASALPAAAATLTVPQQYPTIKAALKAAHKGDTILISPKSGAGDTTYHEALTIKKSITLQGQNGATLDGTGLGDASSGLYIGPDGIDIVKDHVAVRGLTIQNFGGSQFSDTAAIAVGFFNDDFSAFTAASNIEISNCTIRNNHKGVSIIGFNGDNPFFGTGTPTTGYTLFSDTVTNNDSDGVQISGGAISVTSSQFAQNGRNNVDSTGDGLDLVGFGLTVAGNEFTANGNQGVNVSATLYNPSVNDPQNPNPSPSIVALNSVHDNAGYGLGASGTLTVTGNAVTRNGGYGIYLAEAGYTTVALNSSTNNLALGVPQPGDPFEAGVGIYVDYSAYDPNTFAPLPLTISANQISGNASDGIALNSVDNCLISANAVTGNAGIGIHLSDLTGFNAPNTITLNVGQNNHPVDAQDDVALAAGTTPNVWTNNRFGSTNPPHLSH